LLPFSPRLRASHSLFLVSDISFIMGVGAVLEPLVVIVLLFGGTWINRATGTNAHRHYARRKSADLVRPTSPDSLESGYSSPTTKDGLLTPRSRSPLHLPDRWHKRQVGLFGLAFEVSSPNTAIFQDRLLSRLLRKLPFLVECWYWALVYWVSLLPCPSATRSISCNLACCCKE
jgi:hypothetical protein